MSDAQHKAERAQDKAERAEVAQELAAQAANGHEGIASGIEEGARRAKVSWIDRRMVTLYLMVVLFFVLSSLWQRSFTSGLRETQRAAFDNCVQIREGNARFNGLLDQQVKNVVNSKTLTADQKAEALKSYATAHLNLPNCESQRP